MNCDVMQMNCVFNLSNIIIFCKERKRGRLKLYIENEMNNNNNIIN